jgi:hypothetical protein
VTSSEGLSQELWMRLMVGLKLSLGSSTTQKSLVRNDLRLCELVPPYEVLSQRVIGKPVLPTYFFYRRTLKQSMNLIP